MNKALHTTNPVFDNRATSKIPLTEIQTSVNPPVLQDLHQREFTYLRLSITDVCNFKCTYCLPDGYHETQKKNFLTQAEIKTIVSAFALVGTSKIRITGGEPTVRKDLEEIIKICAQTVGIKQVALTSNGYKLAPRLPQLVANGLTALNISMDSINAETFHEITGRDVFPQVMESLTVALALGIKVKINAVLLKQNNASQLPQFLALIKKTKTTIRFIELMKTGDNNTFFSNQHLRGNTIKNQLLLDGWQQIKRSKTAGPAQEFSHPDYQGNIGLIMPYSNDFCKSCNRLRVSSEGKLHLCLFAEANDDLRTVLKQTQSTAEYSTVQLAEHLQTVLYGKLKGHKLHQGETGIMKNLAMLGG